MDYQKKIVAFSIVMTLLNSYFQQIYLVPFLNVIKIWKKY